MCSDLFCAFQPKRLMVPSLPLWLKAPLTPKLLLRFTSSLFNKVESSMFSIKPEPKVGVGMRKITSFSDTAVAKLGCGSVVLLLHVPASERPVTVYRSSTPPFGSLVFTVPLVLKKNGKRASRVGPLAVMKDGTVFPGATPFVGNEN